MVKCDLERGGKYELPLDCPAPPGPRGQQCPGSNFLPVTDTPGVFTNHQEVGGNE
jgi:hypothetical protein